MPPDFQREFAGALLDPEAPLPSSVVSHNSSDPRKRFAVYRNNVMVGLIGALEARFPATRRIVGEAFFAAAARAFAAANPPRSPLMLTYGDEFPAFLGAFEPAEEIAYLADVARLEAARTRAYHAADAKPLAPTALADIAPDAIADLRFTLHPSVEIISSDFPVVTIWAMNMDEIELAPLTDWRGEEALVARPALAVEIRRLPAGAAAFLRGLAAGTPLGAAAAAGLASSADFDLAINLAEVFSAGLAIAAAPGPLEELQP